MPNFQWQSIFLGKWQSFFLPVASFILAEILEWWFYASTLKQIFWRDFSYLRHTESIMRLKYNHGSLHQTECQQKHLKVFNCYINFHSWQRCSRLSDSVSKIVLRTMRCFCMQRIMNKCHKETISSHKICSHLLCSFSIMSKMFSNWKLFVSQVVLRTEEFSNWKIFVSQVVLRTVECL